MHTRLEPGKFSRTLGCGGMSHPVRVSCRLWVERVGMLGHWCRQWAQNSVDKRGPEALRSIMGLWGLRKTHAAAAVRSPGLPPARIFFYFVWRFSRPTKTS